MEINELFNECSVCGGKGYTIKMDTGKPKWVDCSCVLHKSKKKLDVSDSKLETYVPNPYYRETLFDKKELERYLKSHTNKIDDIVLFSYLDFVDEFLSYMRLGQKPKNSYFIVAPNNFAKKLFAYTSIIYALEKGLNVTTLLDTKEVYIMLDEGKYADLKTILDADVIFLTLDSAHNMNDTIALRYLMEYCDRKGVCLVVLSRFSRRYFLNFDPIMYENLGVLNPQQYSYGQLELVGFNDQQMFDYQNQIKERERNANKLAFSGGTTNYGNQPRQISAKELKESIRKE